MASFRSGLRAALTAYASTLRQTVRIMVATGAAFAAYKALGLQQGYWAVFTVLIVMQASIGGTLGAAIDRLLGTLIGALLGGIAVAIEPRGPWGLGAILVVVTGIAAAIAASRPRLRIAPVTAAIMLLSAVPGIPVFDFVRDRIVEIGLGGIIGVLAATLILPARSHALLIDRTTVVLRRIGTMLDAQADAIERGVALPSSPDHVALRQALGAVELAMKDADRERASRLADHRVPGSVPRTLWRVRNDLTLIGRAIDEALPVAAAELAISAAALLRAESAQTARCATALTKVTTVEQGDVAEHRARFADAFDAFRRSDAAASLDFTESGRLFGLGFAIDRLHRDLIDLVARIDEIASGKRSTRAPRFERIPNDRIADANEKSASP